MAPPILIYAGETGPFIDAQEAARVLHEDARAARATEIASRKASGAPLDDGDGALVEIAPYVPRPDLEGVRLRVRVVSMKERRPLDSLQWMAFEKLSKARKDGDAQAVAAATDALFEARGAFVKAAVAELAIGDGPSLGVTASIGDAVIDALERAKILVDIFRIAEAHQDLPLGKG